MKKLLGILVLDLLVCSNSFAEKINSLNNIPENWRKGLFDYPLNEKSLKEIANNTYNRSLLKELAVFPFRQSLLFILIILHILYRAIGVVILKRKK